MGYNKRRAFIKANMDLVAQLQTLADTDGMSVIRCRDPEGAGKAQFQVNNVLHSIAIWIPSKAYVRLKVRTKIELDKETGDYLVMVGVFPDGILRGSKPVALDMQSLHASGRFIITDQLTISNWNAIWLRVIGAADDPETKAIIFKYPPDAEGIAWISKQLEPAFIVHITTPEFILHREKYIPVQQLHGSDT